MIPLTCRLRLGAIIEIINPGIPSQVQFGAANYSVSEGAGSVTLTVNRSGSTASPATVDFAIGGSIGFVPCDITSGAAAQNCDYILSAGINLITSCGSDQLCINGRRIAVSDAYFFEPEYQESAGFVYRVYKASFGTTDTYRPSYAEFQPDRSRVIGGSQLDASKAALTEAFVQRSAFLASYPTSQTPQDYVNALNANTGNSLTASEVNALASGLTAGTETRGSVLRKIADNQAFTDREYNRSFALNLYYGYLRRDPEPGGYDFWLGQINRFPLRDVPGQQALVCSFMTSIEYQNRFSSVVTHANGECPQ